jgi:hypothetical protein
MTGMNPATQNPAITERAKWEIAAGIAALLPLLYDAVFRDAVGTAYDSLEQEVWVQLAKEAGGVARTYRLPAGTPAEIAATYGEVTSIFFGPRHGTEIIDLSADAAVIILKRCPFMERAREIFPDCEALFRKCLAYSVITVEQLNPRYSLRFIRSGCMGDRNCELKIAPIEIIEKEISP